MRNRRVLGAAGALVVFGALIGVTQISNADTQTAAPAGSGRGKQVNGLTILTDTCADSELTAHDGFQKGDRCVSTEFGELAGAAKNPTLLITGAPAAVRAGEPFQLKVSTRNLVRDRFLAAGKGGYYVESSVLTAEGLVRGHFHTACRMLSSTREAVDPAPVPAFFVATEDGAGGERPDTVTIQVPGMPDAGTAQCASWAGDGSHRVPMMERANQTPAFDAVRIRVAPPAEEPPAEEPPAEEPPGEEPPGEEAPGERPPGDKPPAEEPPAAEGDDGNDGDEPPARPEPTEPSRAAVAPKPPAKPVARSSSKPAAARAGTDADQRNEGSDDPGAGSTGSEEGADQRDGDSDRAGGGNEREEDSDQPAAVDRDELPVEENADEALADTGAADAEAPARTVAAEADSTGRLALTGASTIKVIGGGLVLVGAGLLAMFVTRRRSPRSHWR